MEGLRDVHAGVGRGLKVACLEAGMGVVGYSKLGRGAAKGKAS